MKKFFIAAIFALSILAPSKGMAQTQNFTSISSATYASVQVSTTAPTRVDNVSTSDGAAGVMKNRSQIKVVNPSTNACSIFCGYNNSVSTVSSNANFGEELTAGAKVNIDASSLVPYYCQAAPTGACGTTPPYINTQQARPIRPVGAAN